MDTMGIEWGESHDDGVQQINANNIYIHDLRVSRKSRFPKSWPIF